MVRILVIDHDPQIRRFLSVSLGVSGHKVVEAEDAAAGLSMLNGRRHDLVILDIDLPDMDGQELVSAIREDNSMPIIIVSARSEEAEKVEALDRGANDFVVKPFGVGEMLARVRVALRQDAARSRPAVVVAGDVCIDLDRRSVTRGGEPVHLTKRESDLLRAIASNPGHVLSHQHVAKLAWGARGADDAARLRVYINQLRQKLETDPSEPRIILTEAGLGYRLRSDRNA